jgi:ferredoxin
MTLEFGRTPGPAEVVIDHDRCTACALCERVCSGGPLHLENGVMQIDQSRGFGCIACGQCVAVCPSGCITVKGRDLAPADVVDLPPPDACADYGQLQNLMRTRRSTRHFLDREIDRDALAKILAAASTAPMGIPPSEVSVLVLHGPARVRQFRDDLLLRAESMRWQFSPAVLALLRPFLGKEVCAMLQAFVRPVIAHYRQKDREGVDCFFYDAPLALFFYGSACADPADAVIAATYAMLAGQTLGLGSCLLGFPGPILKYSRALKVKYQLPSRMQPGMAVIFGHPAVQYRRALTRRFAAVRYG